MKNKIFILIILCISILLVSRTLRSGLWSVQDDLHIFRLSEYSLCFESGQFPCRYSPGSALGFGSPIFNFYPPLTYFLGTVFHFLGFSFIDSTKIIYILPLFFGPLFMYFLASYFFGLSGGLIASLVFASSPYQAVNLYVRGALAENFALNLIPVILYLFVKKRQKLTIITLTLLFLTHQLTTLYAVSLLFLISIYQKQIKAFISVNIWSIFMGAFFLLPALLEKNLTTNHLMTQGYFNYIIHFATLKQLFIDRFWGYGASLWGPKDDMSFQIGYLQWVLPFIATILSFHKRNKHWLLISGTVLCGLLFTFLTHNKSTFIWQSLPFMAYFQFPWRFLGGVILCFSFTSGAIMLFVSKKFQPLIIGLILTCLLILNLTYFREDKWVLLNDQQKLSGANLISQQGAGLTDFYPKYSTNFPTVDNKPNIQIQTGSATDISFNKNSQAAFGQLTITSDLATINLPIAYFPKMELRLDSQKTDYRIDPTLGLIQFDIPNGTHHFHIRFLNTPLRTLANYISLLFTIAFIIKIIRESK